MDHETLTDFHKQSIDNVRRFFVETDRPDFDMPHTLVLGMPERVALVIELPSDQGSIPKLAEQAIAHVRQMRQEEPVCLTLVTSAWVNELRFELDKNGERVSDEPTGIRRYEAVLFRTESRDEVLDSIIEIVARDPLPRLNETESYPDATEKVSMLGDAKLLYSPTEH